MTLGRLAEQQTPPLGWCDVADADLDLEPGHLDTMSLSERDAVSVKALGGGKRQPLVAHGVDGADGPAHGAADRSPAVERQQHSQRKQSNDGGEGQ